MAATDDGGAQDGPTRDALGTYLREIRHADLLSREDEQRLARAIQEGRAAVRELDGGRQLGEGRRPPVLRLQGVPGADDALLAAAADPVSTSDRAGSADGFELGDLVADASAEEAIEQRLAALVPDHMERLLAALPDRDRMVLCLRFGLDGHDPRSRAAVGALLGMTGERVRQIEARALNRLRVHPEALEAWRGLAG